MSALTLKEWDALPSSQRWLALDLLKPDARRQLDEREARHIAAEEARKAEDERRVQRAFFDNVMRDMPHSLVSSFDIARHPNPQVHSRVMKWQPNAMGVMLSGPTGRGKSRTLVKLVERLALEGHRTRYWSVPRLADHISATAFESSGELDKLLRGLETCAVLALDDVGAHRPTERVATALHRVIDTRYGEGRPILITTNCSPEQLQRQLLDEHGRTIRRIREMTQPITF